MISPKRKHNRHPTNQAAATVLRLTREIEFWKAEHSALLQKVYPRTWREEFWKVELRKLKDAK